MPVLIAIAGEPRLHKSTARKIARVRDRSTIPPPVIHCFIDSESVASVYARVTQIARATEKSGSVASVNTL